ncbi:MAG: hypothetical protein K5663_08405 [Clostridiales bacterium]|nr:hypothetical protein [Clostridiales bacterium]
MTDFEKVVKGLEAHIGEHKTCLFCPYTSIEGATCMTQLLKDALTLIREQQPGVIRFNEIDNYEVLYLEVKGVTTEDGLAPWVKTRNGYWFSPLICGKSQPEMKLATEKEYGSIARCWTARPTDEQREAVKWDE